MKKFHFKLEKVLDLRSREEKLIQSELALAVGKQNILRTKQQKYRDEVAQQKTLFHDKMAGNEIDFNELLNFQRFSEFADRVIEKSEIDIREMEPAINEIRARLSEAMKKRKALEKLKERKKQTWDDILKQTTEKELDDINQKIYFKNNNLI
ncbi:MAG: flagellar export protein FliJ [Spirochaetes bacterium]|nr:flagellar export protein FliJ [Spirochaetota bacterium]